MVREIVDATAGKLTLDHCRIWMDFNCRSDRHRLARVFQRQAFLRRTDGRGGWILSG